MKLFKLLIASSILVVLAAMSGCSTSPVTAALNFAKWDGAISNPGIGTQKHGEACAQSILGLVAFGDASIEKAKKDAGITKVATVDHATTNVLYFYGQYCTEVYGE